MYADKGMGRIRGARAHHGSVKCHRPVFATLPCTAQLCNAGILKGDEGKRVPSGDEGKRVPSGHNGEAVSDPQSSTETSAEHG